MLRSVCRYFGSFGPGPLVQKKFLKDKYFFVFINYFFPFQVELLVHYFVAH